MYIWTSLIIQDNFPVVKKSNIVQHFFGGGGRGGQLHESGEGCFRRQLSFLCRTLVAVPLLTPIAALGKQQDGDNSSLSLKLSPSCLFFYSIQPLVKFTVKWTIT